MVVLGVPFLIGLLMNIPLRAAKKKKYGKKGTDTGTGTGSTLDTHTSLQDANTDTAVAAKKQRKIFGKSNREASVAPG